MAKSQKSLPGQISKQSEMIGPTATPIPSPAPMPIVTRDSSGVIVT